jgi:hypothetical protein
MCEFGLAPREPALSQEPPGASRSSRIGEDPSRAGWRSSGGLRAAPGAEDALEGAHASVAKVQLFQSVTRACARVGPNKSLSLGELDVSVC